MNIAELRQLPQERLVDIVREQDLANGKPVDQMRSDEFAQPRPARPTLESKTTCWLAASST